MESVLNVLQIKKGGKDKNIFMDFVTITKSEKLAKLNLIKKIKMEIVMLVNDEKKGYNF